MKPLSPEAQKALLDYRREHALPPALRGRLLAELVRKRQLEDASALVEHAPRTPVEARRLLRVLRWAGPVSVLIGLGVWFYPSAPLTQAPEPPVPASADAEPAGPTYELPAAGPVDPSTPSDPALTRVPRPRSADKSRTVRTAFRQAAPRATPTLAQQTAGQVDAVQELRSVPERESPPASSRPLAASPPSQMIVPYDSRRGVAAIQSQPGGGSRARPSLDEEVMQMRTAYDHLRAGEPLRALSALSEHAYRFPDGKLVTMRKVARIQALCDLGKRSDASEEAARFLEEHGNSPYAARVRQVCVARSASPK
jgi:hypothetical protein